MQKLREFFKKKNKLVSNDSELSNSARNGRKKFVDKFNSENILKN